MSGEDPFDLIQSLATDETVRENPYSAYALARSFGEVIRVEDGFYLATSYSAVDQVLRGQAFGKHPIADNNPRRSTFDPSYPLSMLFLDPPEHTRLRRSVVSFFTPSKIQLLEPTISRSTAKLFETLISNGGGDIVEDVAVKLPISVIADMLGVSTDEHEGLREEVAILARSLDIGPGSRDAVKDTLDAAGISLLSFFTDLIENKPAGSTLLSSLLEGPNPLSVKEAAVMAMLLFIAGFETTSNLIGSMVHQLLSDDVLCERVLDPNTNLANVVEEFLRLESPVQLDGRVVHSDVLVAGTELKVGNFVLTLIGGANRDPAVFSNPDQYDFTRSGKSVMSFGAGIHHCVGAALARSEARVFLEHFVKLPRPRLVTAERKPSLTLRGFKKVEIKLSVD